MRLTALQHRVPACIVVVLLLAASVYRAATLSISLDEATTYLSFVAPPFRQILSTYSPNNNVLYSLLAKMSTEAFGVSEFSLRLPAIAGGLLTLIAVIGLGGVMFRREWIRLLFLLLVALNPMIFDYMSQARGYSLALGFYLLGLLWANARAGRFRLAGSGVLFGLAVAAHLSFAIPVVAFDLIFIVLESGSLRRLAWIVLPQMCVAAAITAGPLLHAHRSEFVGGYSSVVQTLDNFSISCLLHDWEGNGVWTYQDNTFVSGFLYPAFRWIFPLFMAGAGLLAMVDWQKDRERHWFSISIGTLLFSFVALILLHASAGAPYPFARFVLYWWPLWGLAVCLMIEQLQWGTRLMVVGFCLLMVVQSALQLDFDHFGWLQYSAGTNRIAEFIRADSLKTKGREVTIVTSGSLFACLSYYRSIDSIPNWKLLSSIDAPPMGDYIVMDVFDQTRGLPAGYSVAWRDRLSGAIVARRI
ncbi:MAG TPA: hypothetical protein VHC90_25225 [Bryobacteraceae bacterium]|nr:hypothetical protein [Bryobacteraceae bacterium]